jgi:thioester reductase-like protein
MIIMPKFDFVEFMNIIQDYRATILNLVPVIATTIVKDPSTKNYDLSSVRQLICAAAPLSRTTIEQVNEIFPNVIFNQAWGMTEVSVGALGKIKDGSCGRVACNAELKFVDITDKKTELGRNKHGELCIRAPTVTIGYWNNPEANANTIIDGWLHSGDVAYIDDEGDVFIVDRLKELIKCNGEQVAPVELESILLKHESIMECVVIGVPDETAGEVPKAIIVRRNGHDHLTSVDIMTYVNEKVSSFKHIRHVHFTDKIPRTGSNKIQRKVCRDLFGTVEKLAIAKKSPGSVENVLYNLLVDLIGVEISADVPLVQLGIDSLRSQRLVTQLEKGFDLKIEAKKIFNSRLSMNDILRLIRNENVSQRKMDWEKESILDGRIVPEHPSSTVERTLSDKRGVFLTGCTGFLGCFLLAELLASTHESCKVYCLVRNRENKSSMDRIKDAFSFFKIPWNSSYNTRIMPIEGALDKKYFKMTPDKFRKLAEQVDVIYHNGAQVNWAMSYDQLKPDNVIGTREVIRLACTSHLKPVHLISTIGTIMTENGMVDQHETKDQLYMRLNTLNGYAATKWVAEQYIHQARNRGVPVTIFRPGMIGSASTSGASNPRDWVTRLIVGCLALGASPITNGETLNCLPVDFIARLIVTESQKQHVHPLLIVNSSENDLVFGEIFKYLNETRGVKQISWDDWHKMVSDRIEDEKVWPLRSLFNNGLPAASVKAVIDSVALPKVTIELLAKGIQFMAELDR